MDIIIIGTNDIKSLSLIDPAYAVEGVRDFIGNAGALDDDQFEWDYEQNVYLCSQ